MTWFKRKTHTLRIRRIFQTVEVSLFGSKPWTGQVEAIEYDSQDNRVTIRLVAPEEIERKVARAVERQVRWALRSRPML